MPIHQFFLYITGPVHTYLSRVEMQIAAGKFHKHIKKVIKCGPQTHLNDFENQFKVRTLDMLHGNKICFYDFMIVGT